MKQTKSVLSGKEINLTGDNTIITSTNFNVDKYGNVTCNNANITGGKLNLGANVGSILFKAYVPNTSVSTEIQPGVIDVHSDYESSYMVSIGYVNTGDYSRAGFIELVNTDVSEETKIASWGITTPSVTQTSLAEKKKNFEKMQNNALEILKQIDIYKYNLKNEQDTDKKHIGFVIGDNYNYSEEVTSLDNKGVDNYAFTSLCCKAIQELSQKVEELENKLKEKEGK